MPGENKIEDPIIAEIRLIHDPLVLASPGIILY